MINTIILVTVAIFRKVSIPDPDQVLGTDRDRSDRGTEVSQVTGVVPLEEKPGQLPILKVHIVTTKVAILRDIRSPGGPDVVVAGAGEPGTSGREPTEMRSARG